MQSIYIQHYRIRNRNEKKDCESLCSSVFTWQAHNALFIVRCVCKLLIQDMSEEEVIDVLQAPPVSAEKGKGTKEI